MIVVCDTSPIIALARAGRLDLSGQSAGESGDVPVSSFYIDDELLAAHGVTDLEKYSVKAGTKNFIPDFFVD